MPKIIDITNRRFGSWTALAKGERIGTSRWKWLCRCDCGTERQVDRSALTKGLSKSCGCQWRPNTKHGEAPRNNHTRLYRIWKNMRQRCSNPNNPDWKNYGGRGIRICDAWWQDYTRFRDWAVANGYADDLTIDRCPDNDGDYAPENCRWGTRRQQTEHKRARSC
jgi:hypothetical protein